MSLDFSTSKHTPGNGQKFWAMNGTQPGYILTEELKSYILAAVGQANGIASLDSNGKLTESQLPIKADDVKIYDSYANLPGTGDTDTIYVTRDTRKIYIYNGSVYVELTVDISGKADKTYVDTQLALKYSKPNTGIPKTDLASDVQTSLGKADTAIQDISGKADKTTVEGLKADITEVDSRLRGLDMRETDSHSVTLMVDGEGSLKNMIIETGSATEALCVYESDIVTDSYVRTVFGL